MQPLLSIVIPTRNRQKYCIAAIEDILSYDYPLLELCIQDNSDDNQIEQYIINREYDSRLVYQRIPEQIASIFNIGGSLGLATGQYVVMIGDDDTILPALFSAVEYMNKNDIDSLCPIPIINYFWPQSHPKYPEGYLVIPDQEYAYHEQSNFKDNLKLLFKRGAVRYLSYSLPRVYHGIVKRELLEKIKDKAGYYAGGLSPDIYLSVALSFFATNHYTCNFSISVAGACSKSTTSAGVRDGHRGDLKYAPHLNLRGEYVWDKRVPSYYSVETIWTESALKAVDEIEIPNLSNAFSSNYFSAYALMANRPIFKFALQKTLDDVEGIRSVSKSMAIFFNMCLIYFDYFHRNCLKKATKNQVEFTQISDIEEAVRRINEISSRNKNLKVFYVKT